MDSYDRPATNARGAAQLQPACKNTQRPLLPAQASLGRFLLSRLSSLRDAVHPLTPCQTQSTDPSSLHPTPPALLPGYAATLALPHHRRPSLDMFSTLSHSEEDRPTRKKSRSDNRLYNFLTRSRSRSRSRAADPEPPPHHPDPVPTLPPLQTHIRHSSAGSSKDLPPPPSPSSKPTTRLQSRPLSSTTTATNTTITPGTPKARRNPQAPLPPTPDARENGDDAPKPSATRKKLHNLFGIPLAPRKSSRSRSRPTTPRASLDVPPLPGHDDDITPKPRKSFSPHPSRPQSPVTPVKSKSSTVSSTATTSTMSSTASTSLRLPRFFSSRSAPAPETHALQRQQSTTQTPASAPAVVSGPIKRASSHRRGTKPDPAPPPAESSAAPAITHTPATPLTSPASSHHPAAASRLHASHGQKGASLDTGYRYRAAATMGVVDEEGRLSGGSGGPIPLEVQRSRSAKGKARETPDAATPPARGGVGLSKMSSSTRSTKHGSFDFERPGWGAMMMQRAGSSGTTGSTWSRSGESTKQKERESTLGAGLAGVGTLQRDASMKRGKEEQLKAFESDRKRRLGREREREREKAAAQSASQRTTPQGSHSDHAPTSTSTNGTGHTGKSSSLSRATGGKRSVFGNTRTRLAGLSTQHGLFDFEPPVPSPTRSTGSTGTGHEVSVSWGGRGEKEKERSREDRERHKERKGVQRGGGDRPPVPVPMPSGHRSGTKGRSLDLGLGLSWAPTKMREDALLPSSAAFVRSFSRSSSQGRSASGSTNGRSVSSSTAGGHAHAQGGSAWARKAQMAADADEERSKVGREVAELFRGALNEEGYAAFKKYVHQFDAHEMPFDGPTGIITHVERLLRDAPRVREEDRRRLMENFVKIILQNA